MCRRAGFQRGIADSFSIDENCTLSRRMKAVRPLKRREHIPHVQIAVHHSWERIAPVPHEHIDVLFLPPVVRAVVESRVIHGTNWSWLSGSSASSASGWS